ncbi:F-box domain containing protein [Rhodotorula toruloides]|uniref:F-box domain containing protein n=1 Tax=Rhodotorula toruloides TaxID=5286 RepID=A0A511KNQ9_RHOTO|nr:F-box domain containing protein [Rhodotorula toruloides]
MPELSARLLKDWQYYVLEKDQHCVFIPDRFLLRRLCRQCRKKHLIRISFLKRLQPDLHPLVKDCLIPSFSRSTHLRDLGSYVTLFPPPFGLPGHAFDEDIPALDKRLWSFQAEDEENPLTEEPAAASNSTRPARAAKASANKKVGKGKPGKPVEGSRVDKFVKERQEIKKHQEACRAGACGLSLSSVLIANEFRVLQDARMLEKKFGRFIR